MPSVSSQPPTVSPRNAVPIGRHMHGLLELDLDKVLAGRMLLQGGSGAGKSRTMRRIVEEAFDYVQTMIVDPEGEFGNLAEHIGATTLKAGEIAADGLTAAAMRARHHRIALHLDLTDLDPEQRIVKASAFFAGLISAPREDWKHTVLVAIDEGHLLAPHLAGSARDAETRRLGVATLTDLCARGRKRGIAPIIATQRLAKLSSSVVSELQNFLIGVNVFDRDIARAADILGFTRSEAEKLRMLQPGDFYALGPALSCTPVLGHIDETITAHLGATPELHAAADLDRAEAERLLDLGALREAHVPRDEVLKLRGTRALDAFLLDEAAPVASAICLALKTISPNATTSEELARHLAATTEAVDQALDVLAALGAIDTMPRGQGRMARLHARLRAKLSDVPVALLS
ncbi:MULTISPECIES: helicase HerA domain-containing protein [unclassified Novosphingobium]|uniref:helicase HerA domain-containing protein n=1 Tax=unclassified Novosphingobium TaxID=2644732 RepID=UPI0006C8674E|nr:MULTISPECIES: type IV secretory system conjugative DNA transfer family protein [unclassified Novosphingobium]KPH66978.1 AAA ATPase [Novosphingobium sp. ST904]MPS71388.1 ATP-binding protein [Novosphingobium sp.]